jgi:hypothetical protein
MLAPLSRSTRCWRRAKIQRDSASAMTASATQPMFAPGGDELASLAEEQQENADPQQHTEDVADHFLPAEPNLRGHELIRHGAKLANA